MWVQISVSHFPAVPPEESDSTSLSLSSLTCSPPHSPTTVSASPSSFSAFPETSSPPAFAAVDPSRPVSSAPCWCPHILEILSQMSLLGQVSLTPR